MQIILYNNKYKELRVNSVKLVFVQNTVFTWGLFLFTASVAGGSVFVNQQAPNRWLLSAGAGSVVFVFTFVCLSFFSL